MSVGIYGRTFLTPAKTREEPEPLFPLAFVHLNVSPRIAVTTMRALAEVRPVLGQWFHKEERAEDFGDTTELPMLSCLGPQQSLVSRLPFIR